MLPLNYAILHYMTTVPEACADDIITALSPSYQGFSAFTPKAITEALLTAEVNGLLEQTRWTINDQGDLRLFFRAHSEGKATILRYIHP
ncbi:MAG: hypothetical protein IJS54_03115 [Desulfovibrio sp.]|nr:hypothetical protein [Desulfovibrio sp.]